ncbi:CBS domain-containing protein [Candidatus Woesearchaeota archaeon]|nr:CBS domain-containing protein [Candidatus Woesearchaeota archaeon]
MNIKPIVKNDFAVLDEDATLAEIINLLQNFEKRVGLVFRKNKYLGTVEKNALLKSRVDMGEIKVRYYLYPTPILTEETDLIEAANLMHTANVDYLPVEKDKKIIGVISALNLARLASTLPEMKKVKIKDIKLSNPTTVDREEQLFKAITIMHDENVDHVPITDDGKIHGVLSFRDVIRKFLNWAPQKDTSGRFNAAAVRAKGSEGVLPSLASLPVSSCSTNDNLVTISPEDSLDKALSLMAERRVHDLLVMAQEEYKGMLTARSVLKELGRKNLTKDYTLQFVGIKEAKLKPFQKVVLQNLADSVASKIQRKLGLEFLMAIHVKEYGKKEKGREKFSISVRVEWPKHICIASNDDWDLETAVRVALDKLEDEVGRKLGKEMHKGKKKQK